ncbi:MAG: tRNA 2-thiouridine(34) synthase MnmA [Bacteroidota bacterium]|jgi:tRNA-specific 2-thiouridylase
MKRVVVGLSGGVDSAVTAHLLIQQGYEVIGVFMRNWHDESVVINNECPWITDSNDAMLVAEHLGIPFHVLDLSVEYRERIVEYMFREYELGRTPNPDVLCNREIKFDVFLKAAEQLKADFVATGHYVRKSESVENGETRFHLLSGVDGNKDQSYFLCQLNQAQLSKALFPIGELTKPEVRVIAAELQLPNADKKDSQGLCFIGKVKLPVFLQQQLAPKKGRVLRIKDEFLPQLNELVNETSSDPAVLARPQIFTPEMCDDVGEHNGAHYYTVGQRRGLGIGGQAIPLFVVAIDVEKNIVYSAQGETHPAMARRGLAIRNEEAHWIQEHLKPQNGSVLEVECRIRYRQPLFKANVSVGSEFTHVIFHEIQYGVAKGQFAAFYLGEELIGSGAIYE